MITFTVNTEGYEEWVYQMHHRFQGMVKTMIEIHNLIEKNTTPLVPLDTGRLEHSFHPIIYDHSPMYIELHSRYTAIDPYDSYDYAEYQYEGVDWQTGEPLRHPRRGESFYLLKGVQASESMIWTMIETDYLSLFNGGL